MRRIVTAEELLAQARDGRFALEPGDLLTPLVHEVAKRHGIELVPAAIAARERVLLWAGGEGPRPDPARGGKGEGRGAMGEGRGAKGEERRAKGEERGAMGPETRGSSLRPDRPEIEETDSTHPTSVSSVPLVVPPSSSPLTTGRTLTALLDGFPGASTGAAWTVAAPFPWIRALRARAAAPGLSFAVFSVSAWDVGAYTGEVSARMAVDAGASAVVLGLPGTEALPEKQRELLPRRVARALEHGLTPFVGVALGEEDFVAGRSFSVIRNTISRVLEGAGRGAEKIRWFWSHPAGRPPRLAAPASYVAEMEGFLGAAGVGLFDPSGSGATAAFTVEVVE